MPLFHSSPKIDKLAAKGDVVGLLQAMEHHDPDVRVAAARALQPDEEFTRGFPSHAKKTYARVRMGIKTGRGSAAAVAAATRDVTSFFFVFSKTRGRLFYPDVIEAFLRARADEDSGVEAEAVIALERLRVVGNSLLDSGLAAVDVQLGVEDLLRAIDGQLAQGLALLGDRYE